MSETAKYRHLTKKYCYRADGEPACGIDLASQGDPVVPWFWQLDLPPSEFAYYNDNHPLRGPVNLHSDAFKRFVEDASLDVIYCSHLLEDAPIEKWPEIFGVWKTALKVGGVLIVLCPERGLWAAAIAAGQCPNCSHRYEPLLGDIGRIGKESGFEVIEERMTALDDKDYSILAVLKKV